MVWEGEPLAEVESRLAGMGIESVVYDPCGNSPESGDFGSVILQNIANLEAAAESGSVEADE
jgi:zinc transport system substrate-binding protein